MSDEPAGAVGHNLKFVSHSDQGGRGDGVQINVVDGYAYNGPPQSPAASARGCMAR